MAPLFVLRDGRKREFALMPEAIDCATYTDRHQRPVHVVLDPGSERRRLAVHPPPGQQPPLPTRQKGRHSRCRLRSAGRVRWAVQAIRRPTPTREPAP